MTGEYDRDPKQDNIRTRVIDTDSKPGADTTGDGSLDKKLATGDTLAVTPRPGYVKKERPDLTTTLRLTYRKSVGICRAHPEECGAAAAVVLIGSIFFYAAYKTDWFYLNERREVDRSEHPRQIKYERQGTGSEDVPGVDCQAVYDGKKVNPLWKQICGPGPKKNGGSKAVKKNGKKNGKGSAKPKPEPNAKKRPFFYIKTR
ncbi:hypothetical protein KY359_03145 [Candidatus Woesearchaeota archaeon]|nr:hypothetical protein [Candidatus Woesearchaeota archaeon]